MRDPSRYGVSVRLRPSPLYACMCEILWGSQLPPCPIVLISLLFPLSAVQSVQKGKLLFFGILNMSHDIQHLSFISSIYDGQNF